MRNALWMILAATFIAITAPSAYADVRVDVYRDSQTMQIRIDGVHTYTWAVSTGLKRSWTHPGTFRPFWLHRRHYSSRYNNAPMPYSIFYDGNRAIHGTTAVGHLGSRASKGCVRLAIEHAALLFDLVRQHGKENTLVVVH